MSKPDIRRHLRIVFVTSARVRLLKPDRLPFGMAAALLEQCFVYYSCKEPSLTTPQYQFKWPRTLLNITQLQPCILSFILPNICNPYIIPEAESCENRTVVFGRRPRRDTDRLERQSGENFHGEKCLRGRGSEWRGSLSRLLTSSPKHATWLF